MPRSSMDRWGELRDTAGCLRLIRGSLQSDAGLAGCFVRLVALGAVRVVSTASMQAALVLALVFEACEVEDRCERGRGRQARRHLTNSPRGKDEQRNGGTSSSSSESSEAV